MGISPEEFVLFSISLTAIICLLRRSPRFKTNCIKSPPEASLILVLKMVVAAVRGNLKEVLKGHQLLQKRYGSIVAFPLFRTFIRPCILISDYQLVKGIFKTSACFARPNNGFTIYYFDDEVRGLGLHHDEAKWSEIRQFTFRKLQEHGTGKNAFDAISADEASLLITQISENYSNKAVPIDDLFSIPMMNVIWRVISGRRFDFKDTEASRVYHIISKFFSVGDLKTVIFLALLAVLGNISNKLLLWIRFLKPLKTIREFFIEYTKSSKENFKEGEINTFTDAFLQKIQEARDPNSVFFGRVGEENLAATVGELLAVGAKSSSVTLQWITLYLAAYPEKQEILQEELDSVLGGRVPTIDDQKVMPYTTAVIKETMRIATLFPAGVPRQTTEDLTIGGYHISKGTIVASNTVAIHNDPDIWEDPEIFRPERFLCSNAIDKPFFPFGTGKRSCPAEHLAKHNLFIFVTSIFQRFSVSVDNTENINLNPKHYSATLVPSSHNLVFCPR
ncbi:unnamed protein product [Allacma fusca]|uniref:Cytochrome P450 n=1 Tax=Allacma fusca TaxID=39272 RepID=A0A8J2M9Q4_9HEXA|nr:unnamed protein product [Allacma fusca]